MVHTIARFARKRATVSGMATNEMDQSALQRILQERDDYRRWHQELTASICWLEALSQGDSNWELRKLDETRDSHYELTIEDGNGTEVTCTFAPQSSIANIAEALGYEFGRPEVLDDMSALCDTLEQLKADGVELLAIDQDLIDLIGSASYRLEMYYSGLR